MTDKELRDQYIQKKVTQAVNKFKAKVRRAFADYQASEGCSCCQGKDHKNHEDKLGQMLEVPKYSDGSGYNFYKFMSK